MGEKAAGMEKQSFGGSDNPRGNWCSKCVLDASISKNRNIRITKISGTDMMELLDTSLTELQQLKAMLCSISDAPA